MRKRDHLRTHANPCGFTRSKPTREQKCQLQTGTSHAGKTRGSDCIHVTYLKPSTLGMKRLGFGGSLWQRGTLTGRGLFLGAKKKTKNASVSSFLMKRHKFWKIIPIRVTLVVINSAITTTQNQTLTPKMNYHTDLVIMWLHIQKAFLMLATRCHYCSVYGGTETTKVAKRGAQPRA